MNKFELIERESFQYDGEDCDHLVRKYSYGQYEIEERDGGFYILHVTPEITETVHIVSSLKEATEFLDGYQ